MDKLSSWDCLSLIARTDHGAGAQQDVTNAAQPEATQNHSVKRKSPPPVNQRVVGRMNDALALQTDTSSSNHGTHGSAGNRKRARADRDADSSSDTEREQARVVKQRRRRQSLESTLNHLVEWSHEAHDSLRHFEQNHKILKVLGETQEGEIAKLKEGFTDILEATLLYSTRLEEDHGRLDNYEEQANKDRTAAKDLAARIQKQEDDIVAQLRRLLTSKEVTVIIAEERRAREETMKQSTERLKTMMTDNLTLARDRMDKIDKAINTYQKQSDTGISKVEEGLDRCDRRTTETITIVSALQTQISQAASANDIQEHISLEREARKEALERLPGMWTVSASTLFDTRIASLESEFETTTIPRALEPLQNEMNALSESCKQDLGELNAMMAEIQRKLHVDALKAAFAKETARQNNTISGLQQHVAIEREKRAELEKLVAQADVSHAEDKQQILDAIGAQKDDFARKLKELETAHEVAVEASIQRLRVELHSTTEKADSKAKEIEVLRRRLVKVEADTLRESETRKASITGVQKDIKILNERVDNLCDEVLEARTYNTGESLARSQPTLNSANSHLRTELHAETPEIAAREAAQVVHVEDLTTVRMDSPHDTTQATDLHEIHERLNKLESSGPAGSQDQTANVANVQSHLNYLASEVDALRKCVNECSDIVKPMSADIDLLKRQHMNHDADCKAEHRDQAEAMKARADSMKRQLQSRIDKNADLQSHLYNGHRRTDSPRSLETHSPMRAITSPGDQVSVSHTPKITETEHRFASLEARVNKLITAKELWDLNGLPSRLNTWASNICSDLDVCKKGVAEDVATLLAHFKVLQAQHEKQRRDHENLDAQLRILRGNVQNRGS
jgi:hypothetical protein